MNLEHLTQDQIDEEIAWAKCELEEMRYDPQERTSRWYVRQSALRHHLQRFQEEDHRREELKEKLESLGSLSLESQDPGQLTFDWPVQQQDLHRLRDHFANA